MPRNQTIWQMLEASATQLKNRIKREALPETAIVLGSGFRGIEKEMVDAQSVAFSEIVHMPTPTVKGHGAEIILGRLGKKEVCVLTGRVHLYEGRSPQDVVYPIRLLASLGVQNLVLTNASGSVNADLRPGSVVLIRDHINLTGQNCLAGLGDELGNVFVDMQSAYDQAWGEKIADTTEVFSGIYAGVLGPTYETPAETAMLRAMGADIVGMSTVQETIAARQIGMRVLGISFVTNMAGGLGGALAHDDVLELCSQHRERLHKLVSQASQT